MSVWSVALLPARQLAQGLTLLSEIDGPRVAVVREADEPWWKQEIEKVRPEVLLVEPFDRGSGVALLFALTHVFREDPGARMVILRSIQDLSAVRSQLLHLGSEEIVTMPSQGSLPSTLIASAGTLLHLYHDAQPAVLRSFLHDPSNSLDRLYPWLPNVELDADVLSIHRASARSGACASIG